MEFTSAAGSVTVAVDVSDPVGRDFLNTLPFTTTFEEFAGREKIGDLPRSLDTAGSKGSDPEDGDLIYFAPWGNLGFYYDATGVGFDPGVDQVGTFTADEKDLTALESGPVTVSLGH